MTGILLAAIGGLGTYLLYSTIVGKRKSLSIPRSTASAKRYRLFVARWMAELGLMHLKPREVVGAGLALFVLGFLLGTATFGGAVVPLAIGFGAVYLPVTSLRSRSERRTERARDAWPRMIEELRLLTGSLGRSIPHALFETGNRAPQEMRPAFELAEREWLLTTDFDRTITRLKIELHDSTADTICETLAVAHRIGGNDLDKRLGALVEDRTQDLQARKEARAKQAGVLFARRFVLIVPIGMAVAGMSIGTGRSAYSTAVGQLAVVVALAVIGACWWWAGKLLRLPREQRVFG